MTHGTSRNMKALGVEMQALGGEMQALGVDMQAPCCDFEVVHDRGRQLVNASRFEKSFRTPWNGSSEKRAGSSEKRAGSSEKRAGSSEKRVSSKSWT
ncbi:hypothetical protein BD626DRAFT_484087, partial [Schizophyllum amplum]